MLCMSLPSINFAQTTAIPDSNFEQALVDMMIDTNGLNGNILNSDAASVQHLYLFDKGIFDLSGIEAFSSLTYLNAYQNQIHIVDLRENLALEIVDLEDNKVSNLDLSQNINLRELFIISNLLTAIDVSNNSALELLSCNLNSITELDITQNSNLKALWCYSNNLTSLNTQLNTNLEVLFCSNNRLNQLDLSQNPNLESLSCESNGLHTLSVNDNPLLTYLGCGSNDLTSLDITNNPLLVRVLCNNNAIVNLDTNNTPDLFLLYAQNNALESLNLANNSDLKYFRAESNNLMTLDLRSSSNETISDFNVMDNPNLSCIFVDDASANFLEDWHIENSSNFVEDEDEGNALSVEEVQVFEFSIYPNPTVDFVNVRLNQGNDATFKLFTMSGQLMQSRELISVENHISLPNLSSGIYIVAISSESHSTTKKLIVK